MKIQYFGTAAAEGIPALFCNCDVCKKAFKRGGKEFRTRQQAMIDDNLLLDFGPDTLMHFHKYNIKSHNLLNILITHDHDDHFSLDQVLYRGAGYATVTGEGILSFYGSKKITDQVNKFVLERNFSNRVRGVEVVPFKPFSVGKYTITALNAKHDPKSVPFIYLICKDKTKFLYAHDTAYLPEESFDFLTKNLKSPLNCLSLDLTSPYNETAVNSHNSLKTFMETLAKLKELKVINKNTKIIASHVSHNGHANHKELSAELKKHNIELAYDGMVIEF